MKLEDVEAKMNETGIELRNEYTQIGTNDAGLKYGESKTYYTTPTTETFSQAGDSGLTATLTYYSLNECNVCFNNINYELVFPVINNIPEDDYWLATRSASTYQSYCAFQLRIIGDNVTAADLRGSDSSTNNVFIRRLRPIVTLSADTVLSGGDGSKEYPYQLSK